MRGLAATVLLVTLGGCANCNNPTSSSDAAVLDAARTPDAAVTPDAGSRLDASVPDATVVDAAVPDAAMELPDASVPVDASLPPDAAVIPEGCPVDGTLPAHVTGDGEGFLVAGSQQTLRVTVLDDAVLRVTYLGPATETPPRPWGVVDRTGTVTSMSAGSLADGTFALCTSVLRLRADNTGRILVRDVGGAVLADDSAGGHVVEANGGLTLRRALSTGEHVYGLGEHTGLLDKRGAVHTFWNTDAYVASAGGYPANADPLYQSIPILLGLAGGRAYGVFTDNTHRLSMDVGAAQPNVLELRAAGGTVDQYLLAGPALSDVIARYTHLTGHIALPPRWALGYHQSRWGYSPDTRVRDVMQQFRTRGIPADGIWLDIQHMRGFRSFTFDPVTFPNPAQLVSDATALGFKTVIIVDPGIKQDAAWDIHQDGLTGGHFLKTAQGVPYVGQVWPGAALFPDFTRPATRAWFGTLIARSVSLGVAGLWIDMNEPSNFTGSPGGTVPDDLVADGEGIPTTMAEAHNVYALAMARAAHEGLAQAAPLKRPFVLTRAGYAGSHRYASVWTGDAPSTWETLGVTLPMMLNLGLSGQPLVGSDVGGYSGGASAELFARWMQLGSISPFFRGHVTENVNDQEPWAFGAEVEYISKTVMRARYELLPYFYSLLAQSAVDGAPILRPLVFDFQDEPSVATVHDQAMLGPWMMYAPVLQASASTRTVQLPAGEWMEHPSGRVFQGGAPLDVGVRLEALPAFIREGAIIPMGPAMNHSDDAPLSPLTLLVMPGAGSFELYEDAGDGPAHQSGVFRRVSYQQSRTSTGLTLTADTPRGTYVAPDRPLLVHLKPVDNAPLSVLLNNVALPAVGALDAATQGWWVDANDRSVWVKFPDQAPFVLDVAVDFQLGAADMVSVPVEVTVPAGTPLTTPIHIAVSTSGWAHLPLTWNAQHDRATGEVMVPRGQWFEYKYTRGDWSTVEKWTGCVEATNRYALGAAHPGKLDHVDQWADACP